jgi:hypothetical protein
VPVSTVEEVLKVALVRTPEPITWEEPLDDTVTAPVPVPPAVGDDAVLTH